MRKAQTVLIHLVNALIGYLTIPFSILGFVLTTNSSKGWDVQNDDGVIFIPLGIVVLLIVVVLFTANVLKIVYYQKSKAMNVFLHQYIKNISYFIGVFLYLLQLGIHNLK